MKRTPTTGGPFLISSYGGGGLFHVGLPFAERCIASVTPTVVASRVPVALVQGFGWLISVTPGKTRSTVNGVSNLWHNRNRRVRFGAREGEFRSPTFVVSSRDDTRDVYCESPDISETLHASLHQSGQYHFAFSRDDPNRPSGDRMIHRWRQPGRLNNGEAPLWAAFVVVLNTYSVGRMEPVDDIAPVEWIDIDPTESVSHQVTILISDPGVEVSEVPGQRRMGTEGVGKYQLWDGGTVWVVRNKVPLSDETKREIEADFRLQPYRDSVREHGTSQFAQLFLTPDADLWGVWVSMATVTMKV